MNVVLLCAGKGSALFSDGDNVGHVAPARDTAVIWRLLHSVGHFICLSWICLNFNGLQADQHV